FAARCCPGRWRGARVVRLVESHLAQDEEAAMNTTMDVGAAFLARSRALLESEYLPKLERCFSGVDDEAVWWRANEASNSIGNIGLHLCGNVSQWIISGVGGRPYERHRQQEFDERRHIPREELLDQIRRVVREAGEVIGGVAPASLLDPRRIQGYDVTVL